MKFKNVVGVQFHPEQSSSYKSETSLTTVPGNPFSPNELLKKSHSLEFHRLFWKDFADKVKQSSRLNKN